MKQHYMMFAAYNRWANERLYGAVAELGIEAMNRDVGLFFKSTMGTLNHILVADRIWMRRFTGEGDAPVSLDAVLHPNFDALREARREEDARIVNWLTDLTERALMGRFSYMTVTDMRTISQNLAPALSHVFNHQTHHRGQVHSALTILGQPSLALDLIYFQRTPEGRAYS